MAKRRKAKTTYRRRRVGAIATGSIATFGGIAAGALLARIVGSKLLANMDPKISSAVQVAAGVLLAGQRSPMIKAVGFGMFGSGVISAGQSFSLIAGINKSSYLQPVAPDEMSVISGYQGLNYLGNPQQSPELQVISGIGNPAGDPQMSVIAGDDNLCS